MQILNIFPRMMNILSSFFFFFNEIQKFIGFFFFCFALAQNSETYLPIGGKKKPQTYKTQA
jgi:hypothetical protein